MNKQELMKYRLENIEECTRITDISSIKFSNNISQEKRVEKFLEYVCNPYIIKVGDITMKINFKGKVPFSEVIANAANNV